MDNQLSLLSARHISKSFVVNEQQMLVVDDINMSIQHGEFVAIVGPSGCGKSTLLNMFAGLLKVDEGEIALEENPGLSLLGNVGYMPQHDLLLPWRNLLDNVLLGPEVMGVDRSSAEKEARELLPLFGLSGFEGSLPFTLSGGMRQRAALLRTLLCHQELVLLDEPLGALDALTRLQMRDWLAQIWQRLELTMVLVTHDVDEALLLADRVYALSPRPTHVVAELAVDLPRPRHQHLVSTAEFSTLRNNLLASLGITL